MQKIIPVIFVSALGISWGVYFSIVKIAAESGLSYTGIAAVTTIGVMLGMIVIALIRQRWPSWNKNSVLFYTTCAICGYIVPFLIELVCAAQLHAGELTLIVTTSPIFTLIIAWLVKSDHLSWRRGLGIITGSLAVLLVLSDEASGVVINRWAALALVVPVSYACYHNYVAKFWPAGLDSFQVGCGEIIAASLLLMPLYLFFGDLGDVKSNWHAGHWAIVLMIGMAIVDVYLYFEVIRRAGPIFASQANYITVVAGVVGGMIVFSEKPSSNIWISVLLLLLTLHLLSKSKTGRASENASQRSLVN